MPNASRPGRGAKKTAKESANVPPLVPRPNGKGALLAGGLPGNKGGPGRPRDAFREELLRIAQGDGVPVLRAILRGGGALRPKCPTHETPLQCPKKGCGYVPDATSDAVTVITPTADNQLRALDTALKFGLGAKDEVVRSYQFTGEEQAKVWGALIEELTERFGEAGYLEIQEATIARSGVTVPRSPPNGRS